MESRMRSEYPYIIVGGGLAGASAIDGIRAHDRDGPILLVTRENHPPYHRPPLSKDLWSGRQTLDQLPVHPDGYHAEHGVDVLLRRDIVELDPVQNRVWDDHGATYQYGRLLLATGGKPRLLDLPGDSGENVRYFRTLEDYLALASRLDTLQHALVVGGGFIGMELAAALTNAGKEVTLMLRGEHPLAGVLPRDLGLHVAEVYRDKGVETVSGEVLAAVERGQGLFHARTLAGNVVTTQMVIAGVGLDPHDELAEAGGLEVGDGIAVDEFTRTTDPYIHAAGDVAEFPCLALGMRARIEHWDHALHHGRAAGANMAGAKQPYDHLPMFWSDLFDLGFEAVGEVDARLDVDAVWKVEGREGLLFYLREDVVRGVLAWGRFGLMDWARALVREGRATTRTEREALAEAAGAQAAPGA
jgi:NADPH-dependent 2,4-dienoyl-CoA reductase/sulfur reductase-like enzyme